MTYLLIFLGGGVGSVLRFFLSSKISKLILLAEFPLGIMLVNILGSLLAGIGIAIAAKTSNEIFVPIFLIGFLGGFTTFSAFSVEAMALIQAQKILYAGIYIGGSLCLSLLAAFAGFIFSK